MKRKKRRKNTIRLKGWDYTREGIYFITICTQNRVPYFGVIENDKMLYTRLGLVAQKCWGQITNHFKNVSLGEFVIMPEHTHGILVLKSGGNEINESERILSEIEITFKNDLGKTDRSIIRERPETELGFQKNEYMSKISPKPNSVSAIIRSFKSAVTKFANEEQLPFKWQSRFHDRIVFDKSRIHYVSRYIRNNPKNYNKSKVK